MAVFIIATGISLIIILNVYKNMVYIYNYICSNNSYGCPIQVQNLINHIQNRMIQDEVSSRNS